MKTIRWGILGAGDVAEVKSGPAFRELPGSELVAVMRRDATKAADFARRHGAARWYSDGAELIADPEVDAVYVATPPSSHADYVIAALAAGKFVYVEKPMSTDVAGCDAMILADEATGGGRLVVAHYRRALPLFEAVGELLIDGAIGEPTSADIQLAHPAPTGQAADPGRNWRVDPAISGGGLFHDLAPHQLDLVIHWFGAPRDIRPLELPDAPGERVAGEFQTGSGVRVRGRWDFAASGAQDRCEIVGDQGRLEFPFFGSPTLRIERGKSPETRSFEHPRAVQRGLIERVNRFFRGEGPNPCPPEEAKLGISIIENLVSRRSSPKNQSGSTIAP